MMSAVIDLINHYVRVLDRRDLQAWKDCFMDEAGYYIVPRENHERGLPICIVYDDSKERIEDRVTYITSIWHGHYNDYQPRHMISGIYVSEESDGEVKCFANLAYYTTNTDEGTRLICVGEYEMIVVITGKSAKFKEVKVILDTNVLPQAIVYPL